MCVSCFVVLSLFYLCVVCLCSIAFVLNLLTVKFESWTFANFEDCILLNFSMILTAKRHRAMAMKDVPLYFRFLFIMDVRHWPGSQKS